MKDKEEILTMRNSSDQIFRLCDKLLESSIARNNWIPFKRISKGCCKMCSTVSVVTQSLQSTEQVSLHQSIRDDIQSALRFKGN